MRVTEQAGQGQVDGPHPEMGVQGAHCLPEPQPRPSTTQAWAETLRGGSLTLGCFSLPQFTHLKTPGTYRLEPRHEEVDTEGRLLGKAAACTGGRSALQSLRVPALPGLPWVQSPWPGHGGWGRGGIFRVSWSVGTKAMAGTERLATGWGHTAHLAAG